MKAIAINKVALVMLLCCFSLVSVRALADVWVIDVRGGIGPATADHMIRGLEQAQDATAHREALAEVVVELTRSGLDAYFLKPLKLAKAGFILEQTASIGLAGAQQMMGPVIRQMIGRLNGPQLVSVCGSIRQFML